MFRPLQGNLHGDIYKGVHIKIKYSRRYSCVDLEYNIFNFKYLNNLKYKLINKSIFNLFKPFYLP